MIVSARGHHLFLFLSLYSFVTWLETYRLEKEKEWNLVSSCRVRPLWELETSTCIRLTWIFLVRPFRLRRQQLSTYPMWQHLSSNPRVGEKMKDTKTCTQKKKDIKKLQGCHKESSMQKEE